MRRDNLLEEAARLRKNAALELRDATSLSVWPHHREQHRSAYARNIADAEKLERKARLAPSPPV